MVNITHNSTGGELPRTTLHLGLLVTVSFIVFMSGIAITGQDEAPLFGLNFSGDPSSLDELKGLGGGTEAALTTNQMVINAESILEVSVVDIKRSYLNTVDGNFPSEAQLKEEVVDDLLVLTEVEVMVVRNRGKGRLKDDPRINQSKKPKKGELITVTVMGGAVQTRLSHGQATALGVMEVTENFADRSHHSTEHPDIEIERPASGPVENFSFGISPVVSFSEGEDLVLVLETIDVPMVDGGKIPVLSLGHSSSVLHVDKTSGKWRVGKPDGPLFIPDSATQAAVEVRG